jgi:hypothetical protein
MADEPDQESVDTTDPETIDASRYNPRAFVTFLFGSLDKHAICPDLKVVIYGTHRASVDHPERTMKWVFPPRHYFVRGRETSALDSSSRAIAVPVDLSWLRDRSAHLDILDYDPQQCWVGGWPGWLRDE